MEEQVPGVAVPHRATDRFIMHFDEVVDQLGFMRDLDYLAHDFKKLPKSLFGWIVYFNFVGDSAKECVVY